MGCLHDTIPNIMNLLTVRHPYLYICGASILARSSYLDSNKGRCVPWFQDGTNEHLKKPYIKTAIEWHRFVHKLVSLNYRMILMSIYVFLVCIVKGTPSRLVVEIEFWDSLFTFAIWTNSPSSRHRMRIPRQKNHHVSANPFRWAKENASNPDFHGCPPCRRPVVRAVDR